MATAGTLPFPTLAEPARFALGLRAREAHQARLAAKAAARMKDERGSLAAPLDGRRVLVFDPNHDEQDVVGELLRKRGARIPALALTRVSRHDREMRTMLADNVSDLPKPPEPALLTAEIARLTGRERRATCR